MKNKKKKLISVIAVVIAVVLAAGLPIFSKETIADWIGKPYTARKIRMDKHCYACTAGAGSS